MHVVIVGCGRVGSSLAHNLIGEGHTVAIIDRKPAAFERLGSDFTGQQLVGIGFDRDLLVKAGIERAEALAAVTNGGEIAIGGGEAIEAALLHGDPAGREATVGIGLELSLERVAPTVGLEQWDDPSIGSASERPADGEVKVSGYLVGGAAKKGLDEHSHGETLLSRRVGDGIRLGARMGTVKRPANPPRHPGR